MTFEGGGEARPKRWDTGFSSSSHCRVLTELLEEVDDEEECVDADGEERRRGAEAAEAKTGAKIATTRTTRRGRAENALLLLMSARSSLSFSCSSDG